ncbi:MAG: dihydrofolate reductase family protein [Saccharospirillaceae bacterium]|nr:dihydrofolate reductase family protein [Saccharospirillaceae bacterium]
MTNTVYITTSIDGYIADKNNKVDWLHEIENKDGSDLGYLQLMDRIDVLIMGRNTFELVVDFDCDWPYTKPVIVLSTTLKKIPKGYEDKIHLMSGEPAVVLQQAKALGYEHCYIDGGKTIQAFLLQGLIDELIITTIPILLGGGFPLFGQLSESKKYELKESKVFSDEIVKSFFIR